jgi:signal transduction histidine kinase
MNPLYAYSLLPVAAVALLLFFTLVLRVRDHRGLAAYCGSVFIWAAFLLLSYFPALSEFGSRAAAVGSFVAASYVHAAYDFTDRVRSWLVWLAYGVATTLTVVGFFVPGLLYDPVTLSAGPFFWPGMGLAILSATIPLYDLLAAYRDASGSRRRSIAFFGVAGILGYVGAWGNALMLSRGVALPYGMFTVLASLLLISAVVQDALPGADRRLMERSMAYSAVTAFLSAGFLLGVYWLIEEEELITQYRVGALFLVFLAAWAFDPVRQEIQEFIGRRLEPDKAPAADLARELGEQEARTAQAERLAELGQFTSAIAHEIRNPLGVLTAHLRILERSDGVDRDTTEEMRQQIERASHFVDDLLAYGRPKPLTVREVGLKDVASLARTTALAGLGEAGEEVDWDVRIPSHLRVEADQSQLLQVFVILFENALLADGVGRITVDGRQDDEKVSVTIADDGRGVPPEVASRLFEPFVTSRKRDAPKSGTGLGLAIARGIVGRHHGTLEHLAAEPGAVFELTVPRHQPTLAAATVDD